jgi:signal transduction histidine kinase
MYKKSDSAKWSLNNNLELISIISHELRTPLNIILGAQKLLTLNLKENDGVSKSKDKFDRYLASIKTNSYRLQRTINNFIDITDFQQGLCNLNLANDDIIAVIKNLVKYAALAAQQKGINLILCTNSTEKRMAFDKEKIERAVLNLLSNAIKFSEEDSEIGIVVIDRGKSISIVVEDQGKGIPSDKLGDIFDIFIQADRSFTRAHEGSGTGLAIVKAFVELHEGNISAESKEGTGTRFEIELPVKILSESTTRHFKDEDNNIIQKIEVEFSDICGITDIDRFPPYSGVYPPPRISGVF